MGACSPDIPDPPNVSKEALKAIAAEIRLYPIRREIERASRLGLPLVYDGKVYDFTGLGEAQYEKEYADRMAEAMLALQQEYAEPFIQARLEELKASDPEGWAMRQKMAESLADMSAESPDRPLAESLQASILGELGKGGELDPEIEREILQGVRGRQVALNNVAGPAAAHGEAQALSGVVDEQKRMRQQRALQFLSSGITPEDVEYRRFQQNITNLGAFMSGETPIAQFRGLSGAQQGAAPFSGGGPMPTVNTNAPQEGLAYANAIYGAQQNWAQNQINPWLAGIGFASQGAGLGAQFGGWGSV